MRSVMSENRAHPLNIEGDFYVENGCCITCDLPRTLAPDMFRYTAQKDHCYVYKQPSGTKPMLNHRKANESWQPTPGRRLGWFLSHFARRGCNLRWLREDSLP